MWFISLTLIVIGILLVMAAVIATLSTFVVRVGGSFKQRRRMRTTWRNFNLNRIEQGLCTHRAPITSSPGFFLICELPLNHSGEHLDEEGNDLLSTALTL